MYKKRLDYVLCSHMFLNKATHIPRDLHLLVGGRTVYSQNDRRTHLFLMIDFASHLQRFNLGQLALKEENGKSIPVQPPITSTINS